MSFPPPPPPRRNDAFPPPPPPPPRQNNGNAAPPPPPRPPGAVAPIASTTVTQRPSLTRPFPPPPPPPPPPKPPAATTSSQPTAPAAAPPGAAYSRASYSSTGSATTAHYHNQEPYGAATYTVSDASGYNVYGRDTSTVQKRVSNVGVVNLTNTLSTDNDNSVVSAALVGNNGPKSSPLRCQYTHNTASLSFLLPTLLSILWYHDESPAVVQVAMFVMLVIYLLDLINARDGVCVGVWIGSLVLTMVSGFMTLLEVDDAEASGSAMILYLLRLAVEGMSFCSWSCWTTLQCAWIAKDLPSLAKAMEQSLHSLIPPVTSSILSYQILRLLMDYWGMDRVATAAPFLYATWMSVTMSTVGSCRSSFEKNKTNAAPNTISYAISSMSAKIHSIMLMLVPGTVHTIVFWGRIFSRFASYDDLYDLILVWTVPYLMHCIILALGGDQSAYGLPGMLFPKTGTATLRGAVAPMVASLAASMAAQQRYVIPMCQAISYQFNGHDLPSTTVVSIYLTCATLASLFAIWVWGRHSSMTNEPLFGEYHDDVVQLSISAAGMLLGKAFGFPWNLTPLPILAFLGLSVWLTTRMLRYLAIFLFVVHAAGVVLFSYRFASINAEINLPLLGIHLGLVRFGMVEVFASVLIGTVVGFVARPSGGIGSTFLKRVDIPGILMIGYCLMMTVLEATLLRQRRPADLVGKEFDADVEDASFMYQHSTALLTSVLAAAVSTLARRIGVISRASTMAAISIALGKAVAVVIDASDSDNKVRSEGSEERLARRLLYRALTAASLCFVVLAPKVLLEPIYIKTNAKYKRGVADGKPVSSIPTAAFRNIFLYTLVILPVTLFLSVPTVLSPLAMALSSHYHGGAYYNVLPPISEMIGSAISLWGIASLSTLNHYLPDGGAETWKKTSALCLLVGIGVVFSAPSIPEWLVSDTESGISNPYASISSLGSQLAKSGRSRTGGWGLLLASLATLLAVTGPFELRERRPASGRKDKTLFLRMMMFSLMFSSGVSWFVAIQSMSNADFVALAVTSLCCIVVSFFGTVSCVLGYYVETENFDEVDQMARVLMGTFGLFLIVVCGPSLLIPSVSTPLLGTGGCLSTYLTVSTLTTFALALSLRMRATRSVRTRSLANLSCIISFVMAVACLAGRDGISGLDASFDVTMILGVPIFVVGTIFLSPMLFILEGAGSSQRQGSHGRVSGNQKASSAFGFAFNNLSSANRFIPVLVGPVVGFYAASLYIIFVRGSFFFGSGIPKSYGDAFAKILGRNRDNLAAMAEKTTTYSEALVLAARVAGSGVWTAPSIFGPVIHIAGLLATIPSMFLLFSQNSSRVQVLFASPLNIFPLFFCKGTPALQAISLIGIMGGLMQLFMLQRQNHRSQMRI